jgi:hypothetical protein
MNFRFHLLLAAALGLLVTPALHADGFGPNDIAVYQSPDTTSPVLMHLTPDDARVADAKPILDANKAADGWETLMLPGAVTAYFIKPAAKAALSAPTPAPIASPALAPAPALAPKPAPAPAKVTAVTPVSASTPPLTVTAIPAAKQVDPAEVPKFFYGTLKLRTDTKLSGPINAQYVLYSDKGLVIALVDLNDVVLGSPVLGYLNKPVKIYGTAYNSLSGQYPVLHTLTLQSL